MNNFLVEAMAAGRRGAELRAQDAPVSLLEARIARDALEPPSFPRAIERDGGPVRVIAEVKRVSPTVGEIRKGASIAATASGFTRAGAAAVSVLTSAYGFYGRITDLEDARSECEIPLLCKDFVSLAYQVIEARALGASAVLLIAEALEDTVLADLIGVARGAGIEALVEAHTAGGLARAIEAGATVVGINNRDLETLEVNIETTGDLRDLVPVGIPVVSESGIRTLEDVERIEALGVDALLIGEALMRAPEPEMRLREFTRR
ncbi:MAG: indole-3-glycerol phosphate synthase TrpC [Candidatus Geothermincolia bacterium]